MGVLAKAPDPPVHLEALCFLLESIDDDPQAETILDLWPQGSFLGVHGTYQDKVGGIVYAQRAPSHNDAPLSGCIQDGIHDQIVQQVDLVNVEQVPVGESQNTSLQLHLVLLHCQPLVDAPDDVFQPSIEGKLNAAKADITCIYGDIVL